MKVVALGITLSTVRETGKPGATRRKRGPENPPPEKRRGAMGAGERREQGFFSSSWPNCVAPWFAGGDRYDALAARVWNWLLSLFFLR
jgi:hypothetical protein